MTKQGHTYTPKDTVMYENLVKTSFQDAYPEWNPMDGPMMAVIRAYYPIPNSFSKTKRAQAIDGKLQPVTKPDLDNIAKSILDSLNQIAYSDDARIVWMTVGKYYSEKPRAEVVLHELDHREEQKIL